MTFPPDSQDFPLPRQTACLLFYVRQIRSLLFEMYMHFMNFLNLVPAIQTEEASLGSAVFHLSY